MYMYMFLYVLVYFLFREGILIDMRNFFVFKFFYCVRVIYLKFILFVQKIFCIVNKFLKFLKYIMIYMKYRVIYFILIYFFLIFLDYIFFCKIFINFNQE